jgi:hypothetical protein
VYLSSDVHLKNFPESGLPNPLDNKKEILLTSITRKIKEQNKYENKVMAAIIVSTFRATTITLSLLYLNHNSL